MARKNSETKYFYILFLRFFFFKMFKRLIYIAYI